MFSAILVCAACAMLEPSEAAAERRAEPEAMAAYEAARARAGRDADAHVRLALWCEAHGLEAERLKHLAIAVLADPSHATARGLMGLVAYRGDWRSPEAVSARSDPTRRMRRPSPRTTAAAPAWAIPPTPTGRWRSGASSKGSSPRRPPT